MEALNGAQIACKLRNYGRFLGVFASDELPSQVRYPCGLIANTDPGHLPGTHWVAMYINKNGQGEYFDSYGLQPLVKEHEKFLETNCSRWRHSTLTLQSLTSSVCGHFCMLFLHYRAKGYSFQKYLNLMNQGEEHSNDAFALITFSKVFGTVRQCSAACQTCCPAHARSSLLKHSAQQKLHDSHHGTLGSNISSQRYKLKVSQRGT